MSKKLELKCESRTIERVAACFVDVDFGQCRREDNYKFRTPTLRNIAQTGPYMHDGSIKTLDDVVMFYFRDASVTGPDGLELDIKPLSDLSFSDITAMVALLKAMTGDAPKITPPDLP